MLQKTLLLLAMMQMCAPVQAESITQAMPAIQSVPTMSGVAYDEYTEATMNCSHIRTLMGSPSFYRQMQTPTGARTCRVTCTDSSTIRINDSRLNTHLSYGQGLLFRQHPPSPYVQLPGRALLSQPYQNWSAQAVESMIDTMQISDLYNPSPQATHPARRLFTLLLDVMGDADIALPNHAKICALLHSMAHSTAADAVQHKFLSLRTGNAASITIITAEPIHEHGNSNVIQLTIMYKPTGAVECEVTYWDTHKELI